MKPVVVNSRFILAVEMVASIRNSMLFEYGEIGLLFVLRSNSVRKLLLLSSDGENNYRNDRSISRLNISAAVNFQKICTILCTCS